LAIIDLSAAGRQPMLSSDRRFVISYNGEIFNYLELRSELEREGEQFTTTSDTEVLLLGYRRYGAAFFSRCNGMWACAIWDTLSKELFLSRDRFGQKPLFYLETRDGVLFASEMKALYPFLASVQPSASFRKMCDRLMEYESTSDCLVEGIRRFPAGSHARYVDRKLRFQQYWTESDWEYDVPSRYGDQVDEFQTLFLDACRIRMRADVPVATALSGGVDSTAVVCGVREVARRSGDSAKFIRRAFVSSVPGSALDEARDAEEVAKYANIPLTVIPVDPNRAASQLERDLYMFEEVYLTLPSPMMQTYASMRDAGVYVTVDGHGADELLAGYPSSVLRCGFPAFSQWAKLARLYDDLNPRGEYAGANRPRNIGVALAFEAAQALKSLVNFSKRDPLSRHLKSLTQSSILPTLLRNYDRYSMASGVEVRMPFLDHRIVSFCLSLPWTSIVSTTVNKRILRDAVVGFSLESKIRRVKKIGWNAPAYQWLTGPLKPYIEGVIGSAEFKGSDLIDPSSVERRFSRLWKSCSPSFLDAEAAWTAIAPHLWWRSLQAHRSSQSSSRSVERLEGASSTNLGEAAI
jgi:asparagine synthase (glutamine-hydrolysing)